VYSVGVLLWEISKGQPPFYIGDRSYDVSLAVEIVGGLRETTVSDTPIDYVKLYTGKYLKCLKFFITFTVNNIYFLFRMLGW